MGKVAPFLFSVFTWAKKFDGLEPLIAQMQRDEKAAKAILAKVQPLSQLDELLTFKNMS